MKIIVILTVLINIAYAGGDGHGGSAGPSSLVSSFVNLGLLLGFLVWKLKTPISKMFISKSEDVKTQIEKSEAEAKEAEIQMQMQANKMAGANAEIKKIEEGTDSFISSYESTYKKEVTERISYLKVDAEQKIEAERNQMQDDLNSSLLELVISNTKAALKKDPSLSANASKNLVEGL